MAAVLSYSVSILCILLLVINLGYTDKSLRHAERLPFSFCLILSKKQNEICPAINTARSKNASYFDLLSHTLYSAGLHDIFLFQSYWQLFSSRIYWTRKQVNICSIASCRQIRSLITEYKNESTLWKRHRTVTCAGFLTGSIHQKKKKSVGLGRIDPVRKPAQVTVRRRFHRVDSIFYSVVKERIWRQEAIEQMFTCFRIQYIKNIVAVNGFRKSFSSPCRWVLLIVQYIPFFALFMSNRRGWTKKQCWNSWMPFEWNANHFQSEKIIIHVKTETFSERYCAGGGHRKKRCREWQLQPRVRD